MLVKRKKGSSTVISGPSNINNINDNVCIGYSGLFFDASVLTRIAKQVTIDYKNTFNNDIRLLHLIERLSILFHSLTMKSKSRPFGLELLLLGYDDDYGYQIYTINPDGSYYAWNAIAIGGHDSNKITQNLIKYKKRLSSSGDGDGDGGDGNSIENVLKTINTIDIFDSDSSSGTNNNDDDNVIDTFTGTIDSGSSSSSSSRMTWRQVR